MKRARCWKLVRLVQVMVIVPARDELHATARLFSLNEVSVIVEQCQAGLGERQ